jgi:23S rRNA pseudouridine2605 synthase
VSERLQKLLASAGHGSRRQVEQWIREQRLTVDGHVAQLGERAGAGADIRLDGRALPLTQAAAPEREVLIYHKPASEVTTRADPQGRPTVFERLPPPRAGRWVVIGRLDVNTTGLLLFTNDGALAHRLMHPSSEIEREYLVQVRGVPPPAVLARLRQGVMLEDGPARFDHIEPIVDNMGEPVGRGAYGTGADGASADRAPVAGLRVTAFRVVLHEGRNREVRRLWQAVGFEVIRLLRLRYGTVTLPADLRPGRSRALPAAQAALLSLVLAVVAAGLAGAPCVAAADDVPAAASSAAAAAAPSAAAAPGTPAAEPAQLVRISASFELKHAAALLRQVAKLYNAGFVRKDAERVAAEIDALPAEVSRVWDFSASKKGASFPLRVRARLDEFGNVDLDFFSAPEMAAKVREAVDHYLNARGL